MGNPPDVVVNSASRPRLPTRIALLTLPMGGSMSVTGTRLVALSYQLSAISRQSLVWFSVLRSQFQFAMSLLRIANCQSLAGSNKFNSAYITCRYHDSLALYTLASDTPS